MPKESEKKICFVISPIGAAGSNVRAHADDVLRFIIEPAMEAFGIKAVRSDRIDEGGQISRQMFDHIFHSHVCVALLTGNNPNVFYELAVAQCAARPLIILVQEGQELPFDVQDLRCVYYSTEQIGRLVDGYYRDEVIKQLKSLESRSWMVPSLFDQFNGSPKVHTEQQLRRLIEGSRPDILPSGTDIRYALPDDPDRHIVIVTGNLQDLVSVNYDVVVSLENTYLQIGHYFDWRMTGQLRYLDADKSEGGRITRDSLRLALDQEIERLQITLPVMPGTVIATPVNKLAERNIKKVFHLAALSGSLGGGYALSDHIIDDCVRNAFNMFAKLADRDNLQSILLPMIGAYTSSLNHRDIARHILGPVVTKMKNIPACKTTYLLAWIESQRFGYREAAKQMGLKEV